MLELTCPLLLLLPVPRQLLRGRRQLPHLLLRGQRLQLQLGSGQLQAGHRRGQRQQVLALSGAWPVSHCCLPACMHALWTCQKQLLTPTCVPCRCAVADPKGKDAEPYYAYCNYKAYG